MTQPDFIIPDDHPTAREALAEEPLAPFEAVCEAVVARLGTVLPGSVTVEHFPDEPEQYDFEGFAAAALVLYGGSTFGNEGLRGQQGMSEMLTIHVVLLARHLRNAPANPIGAYQLLDDIRRALHGQSMAGSTGMRPMKAELEQRSDQGVYQYRIDFEAAMPALPARRTNAIALPGDRAARRYK